MTMTRYFHYDVFTSTRFEGNQLAIFPDARGMSAEHMQTLAREMNFSESTFLLPPETPDTDIRMRIFTPGGELPMAGHPTIGTTFALADSGVIRRGAGRFVFGLGVGPTPVELTWEGERLAFAWMDQQAPEFRSPAAEEARILRAIGLDAGALRAGSPIQEISCGVPYICVPLASRADVDRAEPDLAALRALPESFADGHHAVFLFSLEPEGSDATIYSRMFAPGVGVPEDAATGSATGPAGCYLVAHQLVPPARWGNMVSLQGVKMQRPSRIHIRITGAIDRVQVGGRAVRVGEGSIEK
jgi:trans-2,3-dihydro-3-hydroxyanthranilate isomerase